MKEVTSTGSCINLVVELYFTFKSINNSIAVNNLVHNLLLVLHPRNKNFVEILNIIYFELCF